MKKFLYIIAMAVATTFASCQKDADVVDSPKGDSAVAFSAESIIPLTRVSGDDWDADDAIGITMVNAEDFTVYYDNMKYIATEGGANISFVPDSKAIYYPEDGSEVSFMAFYPYQESWSYKTFDMVFDISAQDGTPEAQSLVDLLVSPADTDQSSGDCVLEFEHFLSKVQITVNNHSVESAFSDLTSLTASINSYYTQFNIFLGRERNSEAKELKMVKTMTDDNTATFTAIIPTGEVSEEVIFTDGNKYYTAQLEIEDAVMGTQYNFNATVGYQGADIVELTSDSVTDWNTQGEIALNTDIELVSGVYQIYTAKGMEIFAELVNGGSTSINGRLMNDIDLGGSEENQWSAIGWYESYSNYCGYSGTFDGGGFKVSGLYINKTSSTHQGLFGYTRYATICNLGVGGSVTGHYYVGGVVGYSHYSEIINCYNTAAVSGASSCGGIAGVSKASSASLSEIINCYNTGTIKGTNYTGGVVGYSYYNEVINCYNTGMVNTSSRDSYVGGIMGASSDSKVINCYNTGAVSGATNYIGGVIGQNNTSSEVKNCYFDSSVYTGNAVGMDDNSSNTIATGYSITYMQSDNFAKLLNNGAYTYNEGLPEIEAYAWVAVSGDYPTFYTESEPTYSQFDIAYDTESDVYQIYTANGMRAFADLVNGTEQSVSDLQINSCAEDIDKNFIFGSTNNSINGKLTNNITLSGEWTPIGDDSNNYKGSFDGGGHTINGLNINLPDSDNVGLFGYTVGATIKNVGVSGSVIGCSRVAGIVGYARDDTKVSSCYNTATIYGSKNSVGGIIGCITLSDVYDCYNTGSIEGGDKQVGGIVGLYITSSSLNNCYSTGNVVGLQENAYAIGGILGTSTSYVYYCYYEKRETDIFSSAVVFKTDCEKYKGLSGDEMKGGEETEGSPLYYFTNESYGNSNEWTTDTEGINNGYPILKWQVK